MNNLDLDPRLPVLQNADLRDKIVLVRVDHNVVKKGEIRDPYRIDATFGTLYNIVERGGRLILMTHIGRTRDKKTGRIKVGDETAVQPVVEYLERKLHTRFTIPEFPVDPERGVREIDASINWHIRDLRAHRIGGIYLPNTRWFEGEEATGEKRQRFASQLAALADVYVNDAFGSWQSHASTSDVAEYLPSFAGFLLQKELSNLKHILEPERPFLAVVAGAKYDTKIGPLKKIYQKVDNLILGGVIYNTFLCAKYDLKIAGVNEDDIKAARDLVEQDREAKKLIELPLVIESDIIEGRIEGKYRTRSIKDLKKGEAPGYFLDVAPESFDSPGVSEVIRSAKTIFVNAVMGFTPHFYEGSAKLDQAIDQNMHAQKFYGGGDTLQEFKNLSPGLYLAAMDSAQYYFFTGGGTVLKAIEDGTPYDLAPVKALIENAGKKLEQSKRHYDPNN
ncbi:MAG: phosphoglycerate kinase [Deltaproteobacteria bacterium]|nr:phosphoglycerate kinase [Deltaproteobacteria bacterium]